MPTGKQKFYKPLLLLLSLLCLNLVVLVDCELFTSVDELSHWPNITLQFSTVLDELVKLEEAKLIRLKKVQESLTGALQIHLRASTPEANTGITSHMSNPINAFVTLNRLNDAINTVHDILDDELILEQSVGIENNNTEISQEAGYSSRLRNIFLRIKQHLPPEDDLRGSGEALLRLQHFYGMSIDDIVRGHFPQNQLWNYPSDRNNNKPVNQHKSPGPEDTQTIRSKFVHMMNAEDCYQLGRIAFWKEYYSIAIQWLNQALQYALDEEDEDDHLINDILEHMAISAYKVGLTEYSLKLTQAWLERDPQNDRAIDNLQFYMEELEEQRIEPSPRLEHDQKSKHFVTTDLDSYSVSDDDIVRRLCQNSGATTTSPSSLNSKLNCYKQIHREHHHLFHEAKIEVLNEDPKIIRIHDIISDKESRYIRETALPRLQRATIYHSSGHGFKTSDYRLAKSSWVSHDEDPVVERIESRLSSMFGLSMEHSEPLQVVNYGLGGFYGPHLDSARSSRLNKAANESALLKELERSDRLATILIYLNHVDAGGATVFPRLNVSVTPVERSAVVWFNIGKEGYSDERSLHTGCPVLLGSKWIATKWPREAANSFRAIKF